MRYQRLFSPLNINGCVIPKRIMLTAAVTRLSSEDGHVTEAIKERYKRIRILVDFSQVWEYSRNYTV